MSFMQKQIRFSTWLQIECIDGTYFEDAVGMTVLSMINEGGEVDSYDVRFDTLCDAVADMLPKAAIRSFTRVDGWGARLSAPGYLDCTEWTVFPTKKEAEEYLDDDLGLD